MIQPMIIWHPLELCIVPERLLQQCFGALVKRSIHRGISVVDEQKSALMQPLPKVFRFLLCVLNGVKISNQKETRDVPELPVIEPDVAGKRHANIRAVLGILLKRGEGSREDIPSLFAVRLRFCASPSQLIQIDEAPYLLLVCRVHLDEALKPVGEVLGADQLVAHCLQSDAPSSNVDDLVIQIRSEIHTGCLSLTPAKSTTRAEAPAE